MILDIVTKFIKTCPHLESFNDIIKNSINYSGEDKDFYLIKEDTYSPILKEYSNGTSIRQFQFIFSSIELYDSKVIQDIQNSEFYKNFINWIDIKSKNLELPVLGDTNESLEIEVLTNGHYYCPFVDQDLGLYKIVFRLKYFKGV